MQRVRPSEVEVLHDQLPQEDQQDYAVENKEVRFEGLKTPLKASHLENVVFDVADFDAGVFPARSVRQESFKPGDAETQRTFILKSNIRHSRFSPT